MDIVGNFEIVRAATGAVLSELKKRQQSVRPLIYFQQPAPTVPWRVALESAEPLTSATAPTPRADEKTIYDWLIGLPGIDIAEAHYRIGLLNPGPHTIVINHIGADIIYTEPSSHAVEVEMPSAGAGGAVVLTINLNEPHPVAHPASLDGRISISPHRWGDRGENISLVANEAIEMILVATTNRRVDWTPVIRGHLNNPTFTPVEVRGDLHQAPLSTTGHHRNAERWICPGLVGPHFIRENEVLT